MSQELQSCEKSLQEEVRHLKDLLEEKDQETSWTNKKTNENHIDTSVLTNAEAALKECKQKCSSLEEEVHIKLEQE